MSLYELNQGLYIAPTPAGAYYSVSSDEETPSRRLLHILLQHDASPLLTIEKLKAWKGVDDEEVALDMLYHAQNLGWVEGLDQQLPAPDGVLEDILPEFLSALSDTGKVLLADAEGLYISSHGFAHETAEELSALSADLANLHERHRLLLCNNLGLNTSAWSLVDAAGNSQIGFWPMYIGEQRFVLVISGLPYLNQPALTRLIWALSMRYAA